MKHYTIFDVFGLLVLTSIAISKAVSCSKTESYITLLKEAGCGKEGILLQEGVCLIQGYSVENVPVKGSTEVHTRVSKEKVRMVNDKENTITIQLTLTLTWIDHRIKTSFSVEDRERGNIELALGRTNNIWKPDVHFYNLKDYDAFTRSTKTKSLKMLSSSPLNVTETVVEYKFRSKATVYCNFDHANYPMDNQKCEFRFGSRSLSFKFVLFDPTNKYHYTKYHNISAFRLITTFTDGDGSDHIGYSRAIGFDLKIHRSLQPFVMKYYLPCIAIVVMSQISFVIPLSAIPGRVALVVTQFLTLTNIFIQQTSESPSAAQLNALGVYLIISLMFVVGTMVEFAFVLLIKRTKEEKCTGAGKVGWAKKQNQRPEAFILEVPPRDEENANKIEETINDKQEDKTGMKMTSFINSLPSTNKIDFAAFAAFIFAYATFNVVYWPYYIASYNSI